MNEIKRFMRYTLPGIVCSFLLLIFLSLSKNIKISDIAGYSNIGQIFGALLLFCGIGFIFSNMYFGVRWVFPFLSIDHTQLFNSLIKSGKIEIESNDNSLIKFSKKDRRIAWSIFTQYWNTTVGEPILEKGEIYFKRIFDVLHSIGATLIGSILCFIIWIILNWYNLICLNKIIPFFFWFLILFLLYKSYSYTKKALQSMLNSTFLKIISKSYGKTTLYFMN